MSAHAASKALVWAVGAGAVSVMQGVGDAAGPLGFLGAKTCVPLAGILVLTLLPAEAFGTLAQTAVEGMNKRLGGGA